MKNKLLGIVFAFFLVSPLFLPRLVLADGMVVYKPDPYSDRWDYVNESNQQAFIDYKDGREKMLISVGIDELGGDAVWIFPVPSEPDNVIIDVVTKLPQLGGEEITKGAKSKLLETRRLLQYTQIYPFIREFFGISIGSSGPLGPPGAGFGAIGGGPDFGGETDVIVYEHLEKEGLTSEVITAKDAQALYQYLQTKGLKIESGSIPVLDHYIGEEFTFVISWITEKVLLPLDPLAIEANLPSYFRYYSDRSRVGPLFDMQIELYFPELKPYMGGPEGVTSRFFQERPELKERVVDFLLNNSSLITPSVKAQKGVLVSFPTKNIYYPLLPTSVYGSEVIPITIRANGFVNPQVFKDIRGYIDTKYFFERFHFYSMRVRDENTSDFYDESQLRDFKYTKIKINAPSKLLSQDLWFKKRAPIKIKFTWFIFYYRLVLTVLLLFLASMITGIIAGFLVFREARSKKEIKKYALLGISNIFSILGLIVTTLLVRTRIVGEEEKALLTELKKRGFSTWGVQRGDLIRKLVFIPVFSVCFLFVSWVLTEVLVFIL